MVDQNGVFPPRDGLHNVAWPEVALREPSPKMAEQLAFQIQERIVDEGWPVGQVLGSEAELLELHGVSRAVFREAVRILENHRVARMRRGPGGGLVVAAPDASALARAAALYLDYQKVTGNDLFDARMAIELRAVELAASNVNEEGMAALRAELALETADVSPDHWHRLHEVIAHLSGNPALALFTSVLVTLTERHGRPTYEAMNREKPRNWMQEEVLFAHEGIVEAIIAGDPGLARHRVKRHLEVMAPLLA